MLPLELEALPLEGLPLEIEVAQELDGVQQLEALPLELVV